eukprot:m51a1_g658 hypothetical protein (137) ;mRNA; f:227806-228633
MGFDLHDGKTSKVLALITIVLLVVNIIVSIIYWATWGYGIHILFMILSYVATVTALVLCVLYTISVAWQKFEGGHWVVALILAIIACILIVWCPFVIWNGPYFGLFSHVCAIVCIIIAVLLMNNGGSSSSSTASKA